MRRIIRSQHVWISGALFIGFCVGASMLENRTALMLSNSLLLIVSLVVACCYAPIAYRAIRDGENATIQHLAYGVALVWSFGTIWRFLTFLWLTSGQPLILVNNDLVSLCQSGMALGGLYHVTSPGALGVSYRRRGFVVAAIIATAFGFAGWMVLAPPDTRPLADAIIPYLPR
jgi:hypothetical protein